MARSESGLWQGALAIVVLAMVGMCMGAMDGDQEESYVADTTSYSPPSPDTGVWQPEVAEGPGVSVAVLIDNSASMQDLAPGDTRAKYVVAREAVEQVLGATRDRVRGDSGAPVKVGIYDFSTGVRQVLPISPYDSAAVERALAAIPPPEGGTAIGDAMDRARRDLYRAGTFRKYLLVITDGENNTGAAPEQVADEIARRSEGGIGIYYVAFDVSPQSFAFVREVGGEVLPAAGGEQLRTALATLYEEKILAEVADYGDAFPQPAVTDTANGSETEP